MPLRPPPSAKNKDGPNSKSSSASPEHYQWSKIIGKADDVPGPNPTPRGYHSANVVNDSMVVIGGCDGGICFNDIWILDLSASCFLISFPPLLSSVFRYLVLIGSLRIVTLVWKDVRIDVEESPKLLAHSATQVRLFNCFLPDQGFTPRLQVGSYLFVIGGHDSVKYRHDVRLFNLSTRISLIFYSSLPIDECPYRLP